MTPFSLNVLEGLLLWLSLNESYLMQEDLIYKKNCEQCLFDAENTKDVEGFKWNKLFVSDTE